VPAVEQTVAVNLHELLEYDAEEPSWNDLLGQLSVLQPVQLVSLV